jgi:hypothetical protein
MNLFKNLKIAIEDYWIWVFVIVILSCGCNTWKWKHIPPTPMHYEWKAEEQDDGGWESASYRYYVIDANADEPDAYFETENEALEYKKDFAEHHDYVIVKIDEKYNVYNMTKPRIILTIE